MTEILSTQTTEEKLAENMSVGIGSSKTREVAMNEYRGRSSLSYNITTTLGSPEVSVQVYLGTDADGNDVWHTVDSSTNDSDIFFLDGPIRRARIQVAETGGTDSLEGISIWSISRPL